MPRKRPPAKPNDQRIAPTNSGPTPSDLPIPAVPLLVFGLLAIVTLSLYYGNAPEMHIQQRLAALQFLAAPDELFYMWCGGRVANFSILDRWPIVMLAVIVLGTAWLAGRLALAALGVRAALDWLERQVFALGVGLNLLSLYALGVGLMGGLKNRWAFVIPIVFVVAASKLARGIGVPLRVAPANPAAHPDQVRSRLGDDDARWLWWLLAALPFALIILLGAMLPPWAYDVREYHLQAPKEWFQNGRIDFLPHNIYANMPLGSELTGLWAMSLYGGPDGWWWGSMTGKTVMASYSLVAAAALVAFGRRLHSLAAGVFAAVLYLSIPWITSIAVTGYNEGPVALFALLTIYSLWIALHSPEQPLPWRLTALSGFCAGSAVACKYPPLLFLVVPLAIWALVSSWIQPRSDEIGPAAREVPRWRFGLVKWTAFTVAALAACGPWFAKNAALTSNPTYPLLYSAFDGKTRTQDKDDQWRKVHSPQPDASGRRFSPTSFSREIAWNGWRTLWASVALPPLIGVALFAKGIRTFFAAIACWAAFVFVSWWLLTHRLDRFLVLLLPLASLVAAMGVFAIRHPAWRFATITLVVIACAVHFPLVALHPDNRYFAPLARLRNDDRELGEAGVRVEAAHRWLNEHAKPDEKVLLLGDAEPFDLEIPAIYNTCFDDCQFTRLLKGRTREERLTSLRAEGVNYVFCSWAHLARYRSPGNYGYTSDYPTPELVHRELINEQRLLIPIALESNESAGELFRVASD